MMELRATLAFILPAKIDRLDLMSTASSHACHGILETCIEVELTVSTVVEQAKRTGAKGTFSFYTITTCS